MKIHVEITLPDDLSADLDELSEHYYPGNHYRYSKYALNAVREKITRDKARQSRAKKVKR